MTTLRLAACAILRRLELPGEPHSSFFLHWNPLSNSQPTGPGTNMEAEFTTGLVVGKTGILQWNSGPCPISRQARSPFNTCVIHSSNPESTGILHSKIPSLVDDVK